MTTANGKRSGARNDETLKELQDTLKCQTMVQKKEEERDRSGSAPLLGEKKKTRSSGEGTRNKKQVVLSEQTKEFLNKLTK